MIIERQSESTIVFGEGARDFLLGLCYTQGESFLIYYTEFYLYVVYSIFNDKVFI